MKWFAADLHIGHKNIIDYCDRPFRTADGQLDTSAMTEQFIKNFNEVVKPGDELYILGDLSFELVEARSFLRAIPGQKFMIWGNHDPKRKERQELEGMFVKAADIMDIKLSDGERAVLCHYPMLQWNKGHHGSYMLHGHTHGLCKYPGNQMRILDVGVDVGHAFDIDVAHDHRKYYPWSEKEITRYMTGREKFKHHPFTGD